MTGKWLDEVNISPVMAGCSPPCQCHWLEELGMPTSLGQPMPRMRRMELSWDEQAQLFFSNSSKMSHSTAPLEWDGKGSCFPGKLFPHGNHELGKSCFYLPLEKPVKFCFASHPCFLLPQFRCSLASSLESSLWFFIHVRFYLPGTSTLECLDPELRFGLGW